MSNAFWMHEDQHNSEALRSTVSERCHGTRELWACYPCDTRAIRCYSMALMVAYGGFSLLLLSCSWEQSMLVLLFHERWNFLKMSTNKHRPLRLPLWPTLGCYQLPATPTMPAVYQGGLTTLHLTVNSLYSRTFLP